MQCYFGIKILLGNFSSIYSFCSLIAASTLTRYSTDTIDKRKKCTWYKYISIYSEKILIILRWFWRKNNFVCLSLCVAQTAHCRNSFFIFARLVVSFCYIFFFCSSSFDSHKNAFLPPIAIISMRPIHSFQRTCVKRIQQTFGTHHRDNIQNAFCVRVISSIFFFFIIFSLFFVAELP